jgi:hypothetical protein
MLPTAALVRQVRLSRLGCPRSCDCLTGIVDRTWEEEI